MAANSDIESFINGFKEEQSYLQEPSDVRLPSEKEDILAEILRVLKIELGDFTLFQIRNIILSITGRAGNVANYSEPLLLFVGIVAVLREIQLRYKEYVAEKDDRFPATIGGVIAISKLLTIASFSVADYYYLMNNPSIIPDKIAGVFFIALFFVEIVTSAMLSAHFPGDDYRAVAFFVDASFLKVGLLAAAILQFFSKTEMIGLIMATVLFPAVLVNICILEQHYQKSKIINAPERDTIGERKRETVPNEETSLLPAGMQNVVTDEESNLPVILISSINESEERQPGPILLSRSKLTFLEELQQRVREIPAYVSCQTVSDTSRQQRTPMR